MTEADSGLPLSVTIRGESAAIARSEAIIEQLTPDEIVEKVLAFYSLVASDLRHGARLLIETDVTNDESHLHKSSVGRFLLKLESYVWGKKGRITEMHQIRRVVPFPDAPFQ